MWKAPYRAKAEVSQSYPDGIVTIYAVTDSAQPGYQPQDTLQKKGTLRYEERRMGIQRYFSAAQNQVQISRVVRVPRRKEVSSQDVAVTEDGAQYRIELVQAVQDVFPPSMDLTLAKIEQVYEVKA